MSLKQHIASIESHIAVAKQEEIKLSGGCKAAAARFRGSLLEIGKICSEGRKDALDIGKAVPVRRRIPKESDPASIESDPEEKKETQIVAPDVLPDASPVLARQDALVDPIVDAARAALAVVPAKKPRAPRKAKVVPAAP